MQEKPGQDGDSEKSKMITDKLAQWKKAAEEFRALDASSFFSRAAAAAPNKPNLDAITGSRGEALTRMWELKEAERKAEIARDLQRFKDEEEGTFEEREKLKAQVEEDIRQFAAQNPTTDYESLEKEALKVRDPAAVTAKLNAWRTRTLQEKEEIEQQIDFGRIVFNLVAAIFYPVTFAIGLITGRPVDLPELDLALYSEITKDIDYKRSRELGKLEEQDAIQTRLRERWQSEAQSFSLNQALMRMEALVESDDGPGIRALLNNVVDNANVYAALLGYGGDELPKRSASPFIMAAQLGHADAVQTLLAAGCDVGSGEEVARSSGHTEVANLIATWKAKT